jgi:hypothetical protein
MTTKHPTVPVRAPRRSSRLCSSAIAFALSHWSTGRHLTDDLSLQLVELTRSREVFARPALCVRAQGSQLRGLSA